MVEFLDGPAAGRSLALRRAPHFLRVVIGPNDTLDALDQPEDYPRFQETIHAYVIESGSWSLVFVRPGGRYEMGRYRHLDGVPHEAMITRTAWIAWLTEHANEAAVAAGLDPWEPA